MLDMIKCSTGGAYYARGEWVPADGNAPVALAAKGFDAAAVATACLLYTSDAADEARV